MLRTRVGYAGGTTKNPTYQDLGDHTESFQVDFDPAVVSYERLLEIFWSSHEPCAKAGSRQYATLLLYEGDEQKKAATASRDGEQARRGREIKTDVRPLGDFWPAEDYHQKYYLRGREDLAKIVQAVHRDPTAFRESTAAARLNAVAGGDLDAASLRAELAFGRLPAPEARILADALKLLAE